MTQCELAYRSRPSQLGTDCSCIFLIANQTLPFPFCCGTGADESRDDSGSNIVVRMLLTAIGTTGTILLSIAGRADRTTGNVVARRGYNPNTKLVMISNKT